ncbi:unnamed protein product [Urochloa humidicola]
MLGSTWLRMFYKQYTSSTHGMFKALVNWIKDSTNFAMFQTEALAGIKVHIEHGMMQIIFETNSTKLKL